MYYENSISVCPGAQMFKALYESRQSFTSLDKATTFTLQRVNTILLLRLTHVNHLLATRLQIRDSDWHHNFWTDFAVDVLAHLPCPFAVPDQCSRSEWSVTNIENNWQRPLANFEFKGSSRAPSSSRVAVGGGITVCAILMTSYRPVQTSRTTNTRTFMASFTRRLHLPS